MSALSDEDLRTCVRVLRVIDADRSQLNGLTAEQRRELLMFAGLVAKPDGHDLAKMAKAHRRTQRAAAKAHDRNMIEQAGLRVQRRAALYAPLWLERPKPDAAEPRPELRQELSCYVCKRRFARMHRYYDSLCDACGDFNYAKREQTANLAGHYAPAPGSKSAFRPP